MESHNHNGKTDRALLIEVHAMVARLDERTAELPEKVDALEKIVAGHTSTLAMFRWVLGGIVVVYTGALGLVAKVWGGA